MEIAQLLIANNFDFENNYAVLSITGYPENIFSTVMEILRRNPDLKIYELILLISQLWRSTLV